MFDFNYPESSRYALSDFDPSCDSITHDVIFVDTNEFAGSVYIDESPYQAARLIAVASGRATKVIRK